MSDSIEHLYELYLKHPVVVTDSRQITPGCIFVGLKGERFDGSEYANSALDQGAAYAVVRQGMVYNTERMIAVDDPLNTLQNLARFHRDRLSIPVIGITGSNGKTTTKELVHSVLSTTYRVSATKGNFNNHIGVPLTLLGIPGDTELAIIEMGANHVGEIAMLCDLARPTHGLVTNIGQAHLEGFGGPEGVKRGKSELYDSLAGSDGIAFVNVNEDFLLDLSSHVSRRILYGSKENAFGITPDYCFDINDNEVEFSDNSGDGFIAWTSLFGDYNLQNVVTAVAVGLHFGVQGDRICEAVSSYVPRNNRSEWVERGSNRWLLDAYNANPTSMANALRSFDELEEPNKIVILGAMKELGEYAAEAHHTLAAQAARIKAERLIFLGEEFRQAAVSVTDRSVESEPTASCLYISQGIKSTSS